MRNIARLGRWSVVLLSIVIGFSGIINVLGQSAASALSPGDTGAWTASPNTMPDGLVEAASVTYNGYIYEMGGSDADNDATSAVYYAALSSDGSVGAWQTSPNSLPSGLTDANAVESDGYVYVIGGNNGNEDMSTVFYAKLNSDGSVGTWTIATNALPNVSSNGGAAYDVANGNVYVYEGNDGPNIYYAQLNSDGSVGTWSTATNAMLTDGEVGSFTINNGYLYATTAAVSPATVYTSQIGSDGSPGVWSTQTNSLPQDLVYASSITSNGYIYMIGSVSPFSAIMYYAPLNSDGSIGTWSLVSNQPISQFFGSELDLYNGYVYMLGGEDFNTAELNQVSYAQLNFINQATVDNANTSAPVVITTPAGTNVTCSSQSTEASQTVQDSGYTYPVGLIKFCFTTSSINNQVTLIFVTDLTPSQVVARDFNPTTGQYMTVPGAVITETTYNGQPALQLTYNVTEGGPLDSDSNIDGTITDPVGLAVPTVSPKAPNTGYGVSKSDPTGTAITAIIVIVILGAVAVGIRKLNSKKLN